MQRLKGLLMQVRVGEYKALLFEYFLQNIQLWLH